MKGEGICYPAFLLGGPNSKPMAFRGPEALFISGRFRAPIGPMKHETLIDSSGRSWTLHTITAIGRWGTWKGQFLLWWRRQYLVEFDATESAGMSLDQLKAHMLQMADLNEAALRADTEVDEQVRQYFLEGWGRHREALVAAETFQGVAEAMGFYSLYADNWFGGRGRSNRAEYLAVVMLAIVMIGMAGLIGSLITSALWSAADFILGIATVWLIGAAAARRCHDFGWRFYPFVMLWLAIAVVEQGVGKYLHFEGGWLGAAVSVLIILALAIPPGTPGENQYDPQPNPGPSL